MSTVEEIEAAIGNLPRKEFWALTDRLMATREEQWDRQFEEDVAAGRLDALWAEAEKEIESGQSKPLDEFLDDQGL
jgi:hypothetical protein